MKINLNIPVPTDVATQRTSTGQSSTPEQRRTVEVDSFASDTVSLSSLSAQVMQMPALRQDKVDALQEKVDNGTYDINPQATAAAMLGN